MTLTPLSSVQRFQRRLERKFAAAAALLEAADDKLGLAEDEFDVNSEHFLDAMDLREVQLTARAGVRLLDIEEARSDSRGIMHAIASHANENWRNRAHVEGAIIAFSLAEIALHSALDMAKQFDGDEIDPRFETPYAVWCIIGQVISKLTCAAHSFNQNLARESIVAGERRIKRKLAMAAA